MRKEFQATIALLPLVYLIIYIYLPILFWSLILVLPIVFLGLRDIFQNRSTIRRNFPFIGRFRYWLEAIRPEIQQYFVEDNANGVPFSREQRSVVYQRSKGVIDTLPFGTQKNVNQVGYEWLNHSLMTREVDISDLRVEIGGPLCTQKYSASLLNISAMSFGALSKNAILSLNKGALNGNFAHNTGEGGISSHHLEYEGDLIWQIGTGYFGCRTPGGEFSKEKFKEKANLKNVKMIEIKLSQGAKPGHGGILPGVKVTAEISEIRGVPVGKDVNSPPKHRTFKNPIELMNWIQTLRDLSNGKPIGIKMCIGKRREILALCKAMIKTGIHPDYIAIDGAEGGTGAAPLEFSNHLGAPGIESLIFMHNCLVGFGLRNNIKIFYSGKVTTAFGIIKMISLGADVIYSARAMMMAIGCIQALRCNNDTCPAGIATQDPWLFNGLDVSHKSRRVTEFHRETLRTVAHLLGAMGVSNNENLRPWHVTKRTAPNIVQHYGEIFEYIKENSLLGDNVPASFKRALEASTPESFFHFKDIK